MLAHTTKKRVDFGVTAFSDTHDLSLGRCLSAKDCLSLTRLSAKLRRNWAQLHLIFSTSCKDTRNDTCFKYHVTGLMCMWSWTEESYAEQNIVTAMLQRSINNTPIERKNTVSYANSLVLW